MNTAFSVIEPGSLRAEIMEIVYCGELNKILLISTWLTLKWSTNSNRNTQNYISSALTHRINILTLFAARIRRKHPTMFIHSIQRGVINRLFL